MNLKNFINKKGIPDSLMFSMENNKYYAIWGFDEIFSIDSEVEPLDELLNNFQKKINTWKRNSDKVAAVGYLSYDAKKLFYPHIKFKPTNQLMPLIWFGKPNTVIEINRSDINDLKNKKSIEIRRTLELKNLEHYKDKINNIKTYLRSGDVYQINYTQPMEYTIEGASEFDVFVALFESSKANFGAYLDTKLFQILSMSPENFFKKTDNKILSSPIKGTIKRSEHIKEDKHLKKKLENSEKDRAEHLMIVDLIRNDIGKICQYGSVETKNLFKVHSFKTIHHMISDISGELNKNIEEIDIFRALFPGGSITGAPKESAMKIIDDIEDYQRGLYTGSIGIISANNDMIFNIAIRTLTLMNGKGIYPVGGGIVWDSNYKDERDEAINKSKILNI